jgi:hypothetical protein
MGKFADTANLDCHLLFADQGKQTSVFRFPLVPVLLPRGCCQGIKRMMMLTTHGLFLTCTQKFYLYIYTTHFKYPGDNPLHFKLEETFHLLGRPMCCSWWRIPSTLVPCLKSTAPPFISNLPSPLPTPLAHTILQRRHQQLSVFLIWNSSVFFHIYIATAAYI